MAAYRRIESFVHRVRERCGAPAPGAWCADFVAALDDDLGTPAALATVHGMVREGNVALDSGDHTAAVGAAGSVRAMTGVLGLDPLAEQWRSAATSDGASRALGSLVEGLLAERTEARAGRDFTAADAVRDRLKSAGITVEDTPDGSLWTVADS